MNTASIVNYFLRFVRNQQLILIVLAVVTGTAAAFGAIVFREAIDLIQTGVYGSSLEQMSNVIHGLSDWQIVAVPTVGGLLIGFFVYYVMPDRRGRGVADVIEAASLRSGSITFKEGLGGAAVSVASIGVGASVGREGPVVHLGATLASLVATRLRLTRSQAVTLLGCGVASAVAASFNAPIAGVFFALEVVIGHYALSAFAPIVISGVIGTIITRLYFGNFPAFIIPDLSLVSFWEFPAFALLGVVSATMAIIFLRSISVATDIADKIPVPNYLKTAVAGLLVGVIALAYPEILGVGYEATDNALNGKYDLTILIALIAAKTAATAIALGGGFGGGVFSPSMFLGAMVGGAFGLIATAIFPDHSSGHSAYTLVGLGAVSGAVLGAPISTILIVFELTADYTLTIAVMMAVVIATVITQQIKGHSFFSWQLERRGISVKGARESGLMSMTRVSDVMSLQYTSIDQNTGIVDVRTKLISAPHSELFVVDEKGALTGTITLSDLPRDAFDHSINEVVKAHDIARMHPPVLAGADSLENALELMQNIGEEHIGVVEDRGSMKLIGFIHEVDVMLIYNRALLEERRAERGET
ncbi:MAG: chloride channel protein [Pseudomonadota bacterium]|nr:chloride channel protein [Pseudomonadota bacterium]